MESNAQIASITRTLPPYHLESIDSEVQESIRNIRTGLEHSIVVGDYDRGCNFYVRAIKKHLYLRYKFSDEDATWLTSTLFKLITLPNLDISLRSKWCKTLATLIGKYRNLSLQLPWKPLHSILLNSAHLNQNRESAYNGKVSEKIHFLAVSELVRKARRYFPLDSSQEILAEFVPLLSAHDSTIFLGMSLLSLFFPCHRNSPFDYHSFLHQIFEYHGWVENSKEWDKLVLSLISRIATSQAGNIDWNPYLPNLFTLLLSMLDITLGATKLPKPKHTRFPMETNAFIPIKRSRIHYFAKVVVYSISSTSNTMTYLKNTFDSIESYYHPSNSGHWSDDLSLLLINLASLYAKRTSEEKDAGKKAYLDETGDSFVSMLLPIALQGIYSKNGNMAKHSRDALKHLIHISPSKSVAALMERVYPALEAVTATHQMSTILETLGTVIDLIVAGKDPKGHEHLAPLLNATLDFINANDNEKTKATFKIYYRLLATVPLLPASSRPDDMDTGVSLSSTTQWFDEWATLFLDRYFTLLSHRDKDEKREEWWDEFMRSTFRLLFMQASPEIYEHLLSKVHGQITRNTFVNAITEYQIICESAAYANPTRALQLFIPSLTRPLSGSISDISKNELTWKLSLTASLVRYCGESLLNYKKELYNLWAATNAHEDKDVCKWSAKMSRNVLRALTQYYPKDYRSLPTKERNDPTLDVFAAWGKTYSFDTADIEWHSPSKAEIDFATEWVGQVLDWATNRIRSAAAASSSKDIYWQSCVQIKEVICGAGSILPQMPDNTTYENENGLAALKHVTIHTQVPYSLDHSISQRIANEMHELVNFLMVKRPDDIVSIRSATKVIAVYFHFHGIDGYDVHLLKGLHAQIKVKYSNHFNGKSKFAARSIKIESAYLNYLKRQNEANFGLPYNAVNKQLLADLWALSTHSYSKVRSLAQGTLTDAVKRVPRSLNDLLPDILRSLSHHDDAKPKAVKGSIYVLSATNIMRKICKEWRWLSTFMHNISKSYVHTELSDQTSLYQLFVGFGAYFSQIPLTTNNYSSNWIENPNISEDVVVAAAQTKARNNMLNIQNYDNVVTKLLELLRSQLHWRYSVIVSTCLLFLTRDDHPVQPDATKWFVRGLASDLSTIRLISNKATSIILKQNKPAQLVHRVLSTERKVTMEDIWNVPQVTNEQEFQNGTFFDKNYLGWNGPHKLIPLQTITGDEATKAALKELFSPSLFEQWLLQLSSDHVPAAKPAGVSNVMHLLARFSSSGGFLQGDKSGDQAASGVLGEFLKPKRTWPYTKSPTLSSSFKVANASLWKGIFQVCGEQVFYNNRALFAAHLKMEDAESQYVVAEVIGGLVRASKRWSYSGVQAVWEFVIGILEKVVSTTGAETLPDWSTCLRFCCYNMDPKRFSPLIDYLLANPFGGSNSSVQVKKLLLIKSVLTELTWRSSRLAISLLSQIGSSIAHPFKQVRHAMGECISVIFANLWIPKSHLTTNSQDLNITRNLDAFVVGLLERLEYWERKAEDINDAEKAERTHFRETILHWLSYTFTFNESFSMVQYLPKLLPHIFAMQRDKDEDIAKQAMQIPALVAQYRFPPELLPSILSATFTVANQPNWHVRSATLPFLQILTFSNKFNLSPLQLQEIQEFAIRHLGDTQIEVRELAKVSLGSIVKSSNADIPALSARLSAIIGAAPLPKRGQPSNEALLVQRHGGVLGLCALASTSPYDVPPWMPSLLSKIASHISDPPPIKNTVKDTFGEFWRTHQDMWPLLKDRFTEDELFQINELVISPTYYV
eukprot:TRINITY_DN3777_c0_g1_i6.p1 TRINITY_DN3777_c0_g1~~TRINITY_DN3777_c0_g1_i6.p1  ORF type:complete len:1780 (-),score=427.71 TRINITY_DN3777_c0_g1_i6:35-5374(-)